ncbi:MAG: amino acid permease [Planctomycetota bacterium]|nr:amino acid permease [Planctomycetota bacterium]
MPDAESKSKLRRQIGLLGAAFLVINGLIGSGIFAMPAKVAVHAGALSPWLFLVVGVMFLAIVLSFAELASYYGRTGGPVVYTTDAYGRFAGFSTGWAIYLSRVTSFAANARLLAEYAGALHPSLAPAPAQQAVFVVVTSALVWSNYRGTKQGVLTLAILTVLKLAPMLLLIALGLQEVTGSTLIPPGPFSVTELGGTALLIAYAYLGFESVSFTAGETEEPKRKIPRALLSTFLCTAALYFLIVLVFVSVVPAERFQGAKLVDVGELLAGRAGGVVIALSALFSISGNLAGIMLTTPRLLFSMAQEHVLPSWFARVHPERATPHVCILFTGALALTLGLVEGFLILAAASTVVRLLGYMMCIAALPRIRRRASDQDCAESFRLPGGMTIPAIGLGICVWLILQSKASAWQILGVLLAIGAALFGAGELVRARRRERDGAGPA